MKRFKTVSLTWKEYVGLREGEKQKKSPTHILAELCPVFSGEIRLGLVDVVIPNVLVKRPVRGSCNVWDLHENPNCMILEELGVIKSRVMAVEADGVLDDGGMERLDAWVVIEVPILVGHDASVSGDII